jgi:hypothetical protein
LVHNFPTDFNFYRSRIREGMDGKWLVTERYTSEPHEESTLPRDGLPLVAADRVVGKAPPGGVIRQSRDGWWWHPNEAHAEVAAKARGERAFIVGDGVIPREIAAHV